MTTAEITPATARADAAAPAGELADRITDCPDTDAGALQAALLRLGALQQTLQLIAAGHYEAPEIAAADALADDEAASHEMPLTAMQLLENWQTAHRGRIATVVIDGHWTRGRCQVTLQPTASDEYSRTVATSAPEREPAIRKALERWEENCEQGRRECDWLEDHWERVDAEREAKRRTV